jgi:PTH1 family peptidyl-tRNA hydrolase
MFFRKKTGGVSWLVVFLGNPGAKYANTRHNIGFMTGDVLAQEKRIKIDRVKYHALTRTCVLGGDGVLLMKPQTYMNLSGDAVQPAMTFYKVPLDHIIVVSDDVSMPVGKLRVRRSGSAGGHNGLKDIIAKCGGDGFPRVKVGVGSPPHPDYDMADWVLSTFQGKDAEEIANAVHRAAAAVETIIAEGVDRAMNQFN